MQSLQKVNVAATAMKKHMPKLESFLQTVAALGLATSGYLVPSLHFRSRRVRHTVFYFQRRVRMCHLLLSAVYRERSPRIRVAE